MSLVACLSLISVLNVVLVTHARPENIFLSDPSEPLLEDPFHDANSNNNLLWNLDEIALNIPDLADITTTSDNIAPFIDTSNNLFATDSLDPLILASTCDTQGSLTDDFLQARDEGSCAAPENRQEEIELPKLFDEDFLLQGLGVDSIRPSNLPDRGDGSKGKPGDVGWSAFGAAIPADFQLQEDPQLCPEAIFLASRTPVCENSVTGGVVWEFGKLYATLLNVIPYTPVCPLNEIWCCSIIYARERKPRERFNPALPYTIAQREILSRLHPTVGYDGLYCHPMLITKDRGSPVSPIK